MTIQEIRESDKVFLTSNDVAKLLGVDPYSAKLRLLARALDCSVSDLIAEEAEAI